MAPKIDAVRQFGIVNFHARNANRAFCHFSLAETARFG
jgi:hypothetical protein